MVVVAVQGAPIELNSAFDKSESRYLILSKA